MQHIRGRGRKIGTGRRACFQQLNKEGQNVEETETLSRTRAFSLRQSATLLAGTSSFILSSLMGNIASHVTLPRGWQRLQAKRSLRRAVVAARPDHED